MVKTSRSLLERGNAGVVARQKRGLLFRKAGDAILDARRPALDQCALALDAEQIFDALHLQLIESPLCRERGEARALLLCAPGIIHDRRDDDALDWLRRGWLAGGSPQGSALSR